MQFLSRASCQVVSATPRSCQAIFKRLISGYCLIGGPLLYSAILTGGTVLAAGSPSLGLTSIRYGIPTGTPVHHGSRDRFCTSERMVCVYVSRRGSVGDIKDQTHNTGSCGVVEVAVRHPSCNSAFASTPPRRVVKPYTWDDAPGMVGLWNTARVVTLVGRRREQAVSGKQPYLSSRGVPLAFLRQTSVFGRWHLVRCLVQRFVQRLVQRLVQCLVQRRSFGKEFRPACTIAGRRI